MSYYKIPNLYKDQTVLLFKQVWVTEKIHGNSSHIIFDPDQPNKLIFYPGGTPLEDFVKIFNEETLLKKIKEHFGEGKKLILYGEHYGGKIQGMREVYGDKNRFALFDIKLDKVWLSFDDVQTIGKTLELDVVPGEQVVCDMEVLTICRDDPSEQAVLNGITEKREREGIVIKPLVELTKNNGQRVIAKYKTDKFMETKTPRKIDKEQMKILTDAKEIAKEWVTHMRLAHILDKFLSPSVKDTGDVIKAIIKDIEIEAKDEITMTKEAEKAIGRLTAKMFKEKIK